MNDTYFINLFKSNQIHESKIDKLSIEAKKYLENRYNDIFRSYKETIYRIIHNIEYLPLCPECGQPVKIRYRYDKLYYHTCGNDTCIYKRKGNGPKETCIQKYGVENQFQRKEIKEKIKETNLQKYGCISHTQNIEWKTKEIKNNIQKYGVENHFQRKEIKEKIKEQNIKKYGVDHYSKTNESKQHMSLIASSKDFQEKRNNTLLKNNTWRSSKDEQYIYNELIKYFNDIKQQYSSDVYPFASDFYISSLNLYIEYQGSDLHGFHPFTNSEKDKIELEKLKQKSEIIKQKTGKNKSRYDNRIYTWTDLDVRKRKIAKENNLNFIEFWNLNEFNNWLEKYIKNNNAQI